MNAVALLTNVLKGRIENPVNNFSLLGQSSRLFFNIISCYGNVLQTHFPFHSNRDSNLIICANLVNEHNSSVLNTDSMSKVS